MNEVYKGRLRSFHHVTYSGEEYTLLDEYDGRETLKAVKKTDCDEYTTRRAWLQNHVGSEAENRQVMESLEFLLPADEIVPSDKVRFITSKYETLFEVMNFGFIRENGKIKQVYFMDPYHFAFVDSGVCWHICQYAEACERVGHKRDKVLFITDRGYAIEDEAKKEVRIYTHTIRDYDGIKDKDFNQTAIQYDTGLYMELNNLGYNAHYRDYYKGRDQAIDYAKSLLKVEV